MLSFKPDEPRFTDARMQHDVSSTISFQPLRLPRDDDEDSTTNAPTKLPFPLERGKVKSNNDVALLEKETADAGVMANASVLDPYSGKKLSVPFVPEYYPLEQSSLKIPQTIPLKSIVSKMANFLREHSIQCGYRSADTGRIDCYINSSMLKFILQLWRFNGNQLNDSSPSAENDKHFPPFFILEVRRRQGCSIKLKKIRGSLFRAVLEGVATVERLARQERQRLRIPKHLEDKAANTTLPISLRAEQFEKCVVVDEMETCLHLLQSNCYDQNLLGMESLSGLTDPNVAHPDCAKFASQEILFGEEIGLGNGLKNRLFAWIVNYGEERSKVENDSETEDDSEDDVSCNDRYGYNLQESMFYLCAIRSLALTVFTNILQQSDCLKGDFIDSGTGDASLAERKKSCPLLKNPDLVRHLVRNLEMATERPEEAALSAKCLRLLSVDNQRGIAGNNNDPRLPSQLMRTTSAMEMLGCAHRYGKAQHLSLERETAELMAILIPPRLRKSRSRDDLVTTRRPSHTRSLESARAV